MASIFNMSERFDFPRLMISFTLESEKMAEWFKASYLGRVREFYFSADLYCRGNILVLDGPINRPGDEQRLRNLAERLKISIEQS